MPVMKNSTAVADTENRKYQIIVATARQLFLEHGYDTSSMDQVARHAGVSKATLYVYFPSKEALLLALVEDEAKATNPGPMWTPGEEPLDVVSTLRVIARKYTELFLTERGFALNRLVTAQAARFPEVGQAFYEAGPKRVHDQVAEFLKAANAAGLLRVEDIDLAVVQFLSLVRGDLSLKWALSLEPPCRKQTEAQIASGIRVFMVAYGAADSPEIDKPR